LPARHCADFLCFGNLQLFEQAEIGVSFPVWKKAAVITLYLHDIEVSVLYMPFEQQTDSTFGGGRETVHLFTENAAHTRLRLQITVQDIDNSCLARTVFAEQSQNLPLLNFKVQVFIYQSATVVMSDVPALYDRCCIHILSVLFHKVMEFFLNLANINDKKGEFQFAAFYF
jgi:hypothetical protein